MLRKAVHYQERLCSTEKGYAVLRKAMQYEQMVRSTRKVTSVVPGEGV